MSEITCPTPAETRRDFKIIDETDDYIVVDKPALLLVHPSKPDGAATLWQELRHLLAFELANAGQISIVNRLDRETSGVVLVAKNREMARTFGLLMQAQQMEKEYRALVHGWPEWERRTVDAPLIRQGEVSFSPIYLKQCVHPRGVEAVTDLIVLRRLEHGSAGRLTLIAARPQTGRTHQIRVHLSVLNHPVVGDKIYGPDERLYLRFIETGWTEELASRLFLRRHALHATRLRINETWDWASPWPADLHSWTDSD